MATSNRANPSPIDLHITKLQCFLFAACIVAVILVVFGSMIGFVLIYDSKNKDPRFQLDSVSVDVVNTTEARWDIAFSLDKSVGDLAVWVRFTGRDYKAESVGIAGNRTVSVTTTNRGFDFSGGRVIKLDQVMFRSNNYDFNVLEAACKDVALVVVASNRNSTTQLVMNGGPRLCPGLPLDT